MNNTETVPWEDKEEGDYFQLGGGGLREGGSNQASRYLS